MSRFLSGGLSALEAYVPGEQPRDKKYIKLNTNESPYPPPESVVNAIDRTEIEDLRLYSDPECKALRAAVSEEYGIDGKNIFLSNGSDEILNFAFMAYGDKGAVFPDITYGFYSVFAELYGIKTDIIPLNDDFTLDVDAFCGKNKLVVIANPNAPTGLALGLEEIEKIVASNPDGVVLIDEAYVDFGAESAYRLTEKYDNLLVVQTFSKSRSMAGARLGFAFANEEIIKDVLEKLKGKVTVMIIAHRRQTIEAADKIIMLDKGKITEYSGIDELRNANLYYAGLFERSKGGCGYVE